MQVYFLECFTGAGCTGVYSSLFAAQRALEAHYVALAGGWYGGAWVQQGGCYVLQPAPQGVLEAVTIIPIILDAPLPFV